MAETKGFEPSRRFPAYSLSRGAPSTTRPRLRWRVYPCMSPGYKAIFPGLRYFLSGLIYLHRRRVSPWVKPDNERAATGKLAIPKGFKAYSCIFLNFHNHKKRYFARSSSSGMGCFHPSGNLWGKGLGFGLVEDFRRFVLYYCSARFGACGDWKSGGRQTRGRDHPIWQDDPCKGRDGGCLG